MIDISVSNDNAATLTGEALLDALQRSLESVKEINQMLSKSDPNPKPTKTTKGGKR